VADDSRGARRSSRDGATRRTPRTSGLTLQRWRPIRHGKPGFAPGLLQRSAGAVEIVPLTVQSVERRALLPAQANGRPPRGLECSRDRVSAHRRAQALRSERVELHHWNCRIRCQWRKKHIAGGECLRQHRRSGRRRARSGSPGVPARRTVHTRRRRRCGCSRCVLARCRRRRQAPELEIAEARLVLLRLRRREPDDGAPDGRMVHDEYGPAGESPRGCLSARLPAAEKKHGAKTQGFSTHEMHVLAQYSGGC
jgi:hypothetical protein